MIMIVRVGTLARYSAIAAPERSEWVSMSSGLKPRVASLITLAAAQSFTRIDADVISFHLPSGVMNRLILRSSGSSDPG